MTTKYVFCDTYQMVFSNFFKNLGNCMKFSNLIVLLSKKGLTVAQNKDRRENLVSGGGHKQANYPRRLKAAEDFDLFIQQSKICGVPLGIIMDY